MFRNIDDISAINGGIYLMCLIVESSLICEYLQNINPIEKIHFVGMKYY